MLIPISILSPCNLRIIAWVICSVSLWICSTKSFITCFMANIKQFFQNSSNIYISDYMGTCSTHKTNAYTFDFYVKCILLFIIGIRFISEKHRKVLLFSFVAIGIYSSMDPYTVQAGLQNFMQTNE